MPKVSMVEAGLNVQFSQAPLAGHRFETARCHARHIQEGDCVGGGFEFRRQREAVIRGQDRIVNPVGEFIVGSAVEFTAV